MSDSISNPARPVPFGVDETEAARAIGMSVAYLRKDRLKMRLFPFFKLGSSVRYDLDRMREAALALEQGAVHLKLKARVSRTLR